MDACKCTSVGVVGCEQWVEDVGTFTALKEKNSRAGDDDASHEGSETREESVNNNVIIFAYYVYTKSRC